MFTATLFCPLAVDAASTLCHRARRDDLAVHSRGQVDADLRKGLSTKSQQSAQPRRKGHAPAVTAGERTACDRVDAAPPRPRVCGRHGAGAEPNGREDYRDRHLPLLRSGADVQLLCRVRLGQRDIVAPQRPRAQPRAQPRASECHDNGGGQQVGGAEAREGSVGRR